MSEPFRLDDAAPIGKPFEFTFRGVPYVLPPWSQWPVTVMHAAASGQVEEALRELLGEEAAERLVDDGLKLGHMMALFEEASRDRGD